jgi:hypothetical protein
MGAVSEHLPPGVTGVGGGAIGRGPGAPEPCGRLLGAWPSPSSAQCPPSGAPAPLRPPPPPPAGLGSAFPWLGASCEPNIALSSHVDRSRPGRGDAGGCSAGTGITAWRGALRGQLRQSLRPGRGSQASKAREERRGGWEPLGYVPASARRGRDGAQKSPSLVRVGDRGRFPCWRPGRATYFLYGRGIRGGI